MTVDQARARPARGILERDRLDQLQGAVLETTPADLWNKTGQGKHLVTVRTVGVRTAIAEEIELVRRSRHDGDRRPEPVVDRNTPDRSQRECRDGEHLDRKGRRALPETCRRSAEHRGDHERAESGKGQRSARNITLVRDAMEWSSVRNRPSTSTKRFERP